MTITVCRNCDERYPACWARCEKYIEAKSELEQLKAKRAETKKKELTISAVQYHGLKRKDKQI